MFLDFVTLLAQIAPPPDDVLTAAETLILQATSNDVPTMAEIAEELRQAVDEQGVRRIILTLFLTGLSVSIGRSYVLLANHVKPRRLIASMLFSVFIFGFSLFVWTTTVYWVGRIFYDIDFAFNYWEINAVVIVAFSPLTQAWLGLIPYIGGCWVRYLYVQSVALLYMVMVLVGFGWRQAFVAILIGALVLLLSQMTILRPFIALQNWIAGTHLRSRYQSVIRESRLELKP